MARELGSLEITKQGQVLSVQFRQKSGELEGVGAELPAQVLSMLEDAGRLVDAGEKFQQLVVSFASYDYVITAGAENVKVSMCEREG